MYRPIAQTCTTCKIMVTIIKVNSFNQSIFLIICGRMQPDKIFLYMKLLDMSSQFLEMAYQTQTNEHKMKQIMQTHE